MDPKNPSSNYILLVEDNRDDIDLTMRALRQHNIANDVVVVQDGAEALDFLFGEGRHADRDATRQPQLILLDINLPKLSGLEVLKRLRSDVRTRLLPVVMLTTSKQDQDIVESYTIGANSYVRKPVNFGEFTEAVRQLGLYWLMLNESPWNPA